MTSWVVADSNILLATVLVEPHREKAQALLRHWAWNDVEVVAPSLFRYEIIAVIRKHVYRGTFSLEDGIKARDQLLSEPIKLLMNDDLLRRAYEMATQFNRPTAYDSQYLAVAEHLGCEFWTADERMFNAVSSALPWVKWISNFSLPGAT